MDDAGVQKYGQDESEALIGRLWRLKSSKSADGTHRARGGLHRVRCLVGSVQTHPVNVGETCDKLHATGESGAKVDEHSTRGSDHYVEAGFGLNRAASNL